MFISSTTWLLRWIKTPLRRPTLRLWLTITASNGIIIRHRSLWLTQHIARATFIFKDNTLGVTAKGSQFNEFKSQFGPDDRGFGYMKVMVRIRNKYFSFIDLDCPRVARLETKCPRDQSSSSVLGLGQTSQLWRKPRCQRTKPWWRSLWRWGNIISIKPPQLTI